ncbi:WGR domain-containing protein [Novosphingobium sp. YJ-S2-02]|uniref:WGR domain-containing protein n=1 Tax=Novosphingobium aureum TaxID=2792964 RepID=A0A931MMN0_9SPHN|nr:WGR domain-containing protein [Novosphingobium aureum]MBH0115208.1 WGR domain-containing protein [Novosphingobium aureum]
MDIETTLNQLLAPAGGCLALEARDPVRGLARRWQVEVAEDLFGWTTLTWTWGRIGSVGQGKQRSFAARCEARKAVRTLLQRRMRAPRRIGVPYLPVAP